MVKLKFKTGDRVKWIHNETGELIERGEVIGYAFVDQENPPSPNSQYNEPDLEICLVELDRTIISHHGRITVNIRTLSLRASVLEHE